jgi:Fe-S-cluster containining protein
MPKQFSLAQIAADYQARHIIPHCPDCSNSCCLLDPLVLELEWKQIKTFWRIDEARQAFDRRLQSGKGPQEIRAGNGRYYVHGKPCPAFDQNARSCSVYGQAIKPRGCSDFPIYDDGDIIMADLRCEAVDRTTLSASLAHAVGEGYRVITQLDPEFPFLITFSLKRKMTARKTCGQPHSAR